MTQIYDVNNIYKQRPMYHAQHQQEKMRVTFLFKRSFFFPQMLEFYDREKKTQVTEVQNKYSLAEKPERFPNTNGDNSKIQTSVQDDRNIEVEIEAKLQDR